MPVFIIINTLIVLTTVVAMEAFAWWAHKYIMHTWGWGWHASHHEHKSAKPAADAPWLARAGYYFEKNDWYAVVFSGVAMALFAIGPLFWVGVGITVYGILYSVAHDGLVHKRWPWRWVPKSGYLKRLYQAHRLHHAVKGPEGCVSFGFLWAPSPAALKRELQEARLQLEARKQGETAVQQP